MNKKVVNKKLLPLCIFSAIISPDLQAVEVTELGAMMVTANKQAQPLEALNSTVLVKTAEELDEAGVETVQDLEKVFPGLVIRTRGNRAYASSTIRGIYSPDFYNPSVMLYVDGVPQDTAFLTQPLLNVERVELLKGPQGTLYGRNAQGGVINVITKQATNKAQAKVGVTYASLTREANVSASGALVKDSLFGNIALKRFDNVGQIKDVATGKDNIDDSQDFMGSARLHYAPKNTDFSASLSVSYEDLDSNEEIYLREDDFDDLEFDSLLAGESNLKRKVTSYALQLDYDMANTTLSSTTAYHDRKIDRLLQGLEYPEDQTTVSQEIKFVTDYSDDLNSLIGLFYQNTDFTRNAQGYPGFFGDGENQVKSDSYAVFGEVNYQMTSKWDGTIGLRWSQEESKIDFSRDNPNGFAFDNNKTFSDVSPKISLGWNYTEDNRVYASVAKGFKPGGFNHTVTNPDDETAFDSETSINGELGWRAKLLNNRVALNVGLYWIELTDTQIYVGPLGQQVIRNSGDAQSYGLDIDAKWFVTDSVQLSAGLNQGKAEFTTVKDSQTGVDYKGNALPYAPETSASLSGRMQFDPSWLSGKWYINAGVRYYSDMYFNETNTLKQPGYSLVGVSTSVEMRNGLMLRAFADNLTDNQYRTSSFVFGPGDIRSTVGYGRNVGLTAEMSF